MTDDRSLERAARSWLESGPTVAPDHAVEAALLRIHTTRQDRMIPVLWRLPTMNGLARLFAGAAAVGIVVVAGLFALRPGSPPSVGASASPSPTAEPSAEPSPSVTATPPVSATPPVAACALVTTAEAADLGLNIGGATNFGSGTGAVTECQYATGEIVLTVTLTKPGGKAAFDEVKSRSGIQVISGVGTDAVFDPASSTMYVFKGDALASILTGSSAQGRAARLADETSIARLVATRL
jgi:hypothetical protein